MNTGSQAPLVPADSLVALLPRLCACWCSFTLGCVSGLDEASRRRHWATFHYEAAVLCSLVGARLAAGSLAPGQCSADEELLYLVAGRNEPQTDDTEYMRTQFRRLISRLVGYACACKAASLALLRLHPGLYNQPPRAKQPPAEAAQLEAVVRGALALVPSAYAGGARCVPYEENGFVLFLKRCTDVRSDWVDFEFVARILPAWKIAQQFLNLDAHGTVTTAAHNLLHNAEEARQARRGGLLRSCNLVSGGALEVRGAMHSLCACRLVVYCCVAHQEADWPRHKGACRKALRRVRSEPRRRAVGGDAAAAAPSRGVAGGCSPCCKMLSTNYHNMIELRRRVILSV